MIQQLFPSRQPQCLRQVKYLPPVVLPSSAYTSGETSGSALPTIDLHIRDGSNPALLFTIVEDIRPEGVSRQLAHYPGESANRSTVNRTCISYPHWQPVILEPETHA